MTTAKSKNNEQEKEYIPYSVWVQDVVDKIDALTDQCLERFYQDRSVNEEILKMLCRVKDIVEDKYRK